MMVDYHDLNSLLITTQIRGYDFAVLDSYGRYLHRLSNHLGLTVSKHWCAPSSTKKVEILKNESLVVETVNELHIYERNIQVQNISARLSSLLVDIVHRSLPVGVYLSIHQHDDTLHEKSRYIPDLLLAEYKEELKELMANKEFVTEPEDPKKKK